MTRYFVWLFVAATAAACDGPAAPTAVVPTPVQPSVPLVSFTDAAGRAGTATSPADVPDSP